MISGHVFIATSLDGFIARKDGDIEWLVRRDDPGEDHGYDDFIDGMDGIVMGRGSYGKVRTFPQWPYRKPVVVLSRQLMAEAVPEELAGRVRFSGLGPAALSAVRTFGGGRFAGARGNEGVSFGAGAVALPGQQAGTAGRAPDLTRLERERFETLPARTIRSSDGSRTRCQRATANPLEPRRLIHGRSTLDSRRGWSLAPRGPADVKWMAVVPLFLFGAFYRSAWPVPWFRRSDGPAMNFGNPPSAVGLGRAFRAGTGRSLDLERMILTGLSPSSQR